MNSRAIQAWLSVLDSISYYDIFRVAPSASADDLRIAFHDFAETFHPDVHQWRDHQEQAAIAHIFRRGTEAYRVLGDPQLRRRYDEALEAGDPRPEHLVVEADTPGPRSLANPQAASGRASDRTRSPGARPFVLRAEELVRNGDPKQAKIQLVMAMHMDAKNPALEAFARELDELVAKKAEEDKKAWHKP